MAIAFNCPHCGVVYRLKDELAGKRATCKNADCRKVIAIPQPMTVPPSAGPPDAPLAAVSPPPVAKDRTPPPRTVADIEAAARAALADAPKAEAKPGDQVIPVVCRYCDHQWTEPLAKAGKNALCPNPDCRQVQKVPVPKDATPQNWRETPKGPSLAKENFEKPKDVVDAEARVVSKKAWEEGGGAEQDLEPIPLTRRVVFALLVIVPVVALLVGVVSWWNGRKDDKQHRLMLDATEEFAKSGSGELTPAQAPLFGAILEIAAGEYEMKQATAAPDRALGHFAKARDALRHAAAKDDKKGSAAGERYAIACELAAATLQLGGTDQEVKDGIRYRWVPADTARKALPNEKRIDVHTELQRTLDLLRPADFDLKAALARRLTADLVARGQPGVAADLPILLFNPPEQAEAKGVVALEMIRRDRGSETARRIAGELKTLLDRGAGDRIPVPSAQALWQTVGTEKTPTLYPAPRPGQPVGDPSRYAFTAVLLLQDKPAEALDLARRLPGTLPGQLRAIALCAEWSADPGPALDAAVAAVNIQTKGKKDLVPSPSVVLRLAQIAAAAGRAEQAKELITFLPDDGLKAWARADALRQTATPQNTARVDEIAAELPDDPKKFRAGHAWGRFWLARHNTRQSGDRSKETKAVTAWAAGTVRPFGFAGVALGLRER